MTPAVRALSSPEEDRVDRKALGAWYTPAELVDLVVDAVVDAEFVAGRDRPVRVLDPACGDGRFLAACRTRIGELGGSVELVGADIDPIAVERGRRRVPGARFVTVDALGHDWTRTDRFDLVIGNPPFVSQMSSTTSRGGASSRGGGPYADVAAEFLALATEVAEPRGGRMAFVLPQSLLAARDARAIRARVDDAATMIWSWWDGRRVFDANVVPCAVAFELGRPDARAAADHSWARVVTGRRGVPDLPPGLEGDEGATCGTLGDRARLNANFRDEYYGMIPAVDDHDAGPPLITSGLIDPGRSLWGCRAVTFAKRRLAAPRVDIELLDDRMRRWARRRLVPKVLVANQTRVIEAVADPGGDWLPAVPVVAIYPHRCDEVWSIAALLTSPIASAWAWHRRGGTGLSADAVRIGPALLAGLPWPSAPLDTAVGRLRSGDVAGCGRAVVDAFDLPRSDADALCAWWEPIVERVLARVD